MIAVDQPTAVSLLRSDVCRFLYELISLDLNTPPIPRTVFGDAESPSVIMLVEEWPWGTNASFSSLDDSFVSEGLTWLLEGHEKLNLGSTDRRVIEYASGVSSVEIGPISCTHSFACTSPDRVPDVLPARRLTADDAAAIERYPTGYRHNGPELPTLFQWFVVEARGRGIGKRMAATYARELLARGDVPYYSGAANEASERTALGAGFHLCREAFSTSVRRNV